MRGLAVITRIIFITVLIPGTVAAAPAFSGMAANALQEWSLAFAGIAPSVAYRINARLSVGVSLPVMYSRYTLEKAVFNPGAADGSFELVADGWGVGAIVGMLYELNPHTRCGLTYRSKVSVTDEGRPDFSDLTEERTQLLNRFGGPGPGYLHRYEHAPGGECRRHTQPAPRPDVGRRTRF